MPPPQAKPDSRIVGVQRLIVKSNASELAGVDRRGFVYKPRKDSRLQTSTHQHVASGLVVLASYHGARPGYDDRSFLGGDLLNRVTKDVLMIQVYRSNDRYDSVNGICRVEPPAQPDLKDGKLRFAISKVA